MINNVVLVGRLTKDPDLKYTPNGVAVVTFTLAVNRNFKNQSGNREADFINCVLWRKPAEALADFTRKGTLIGVEGRIQTRNYENQQGQRVYVTEVIAERFQLLESSTQNQNNVGQNNVDSSTQTNGQVSQHQQTGFFGPGTTNSGDFTSSGTAIDVDDDDLPF